VERTDQPPKHNINPTTNWYMINTPYFIVRPI
jgi:hypothetical protein